MAGAEAEDAQFEPQVQSRESEPQMAHDFKSKLSSDIASHRAVRERETAHADNLCSLKGWLSTGKTFQADSNSFCIIL